MQIDELYDCLFFSVFERSGAILLSFLVLLGFECCGICLMVVLYWVWNKLGGFLYGVILSMFND